MSWVFMVFDAIYLFFTRKINSSHKNAKAITFYINTLDHEIYTVFCLFRFFFLFSLSNNLMNFEHTLPHLSNNIFLLLLLFSLWIQTFTIIKNSSNLPKLEINSIFQCFPDSFREFSRVSAHFPKYFGFLASKEIITSQFNSSVPSVDCGKYWAA